VKRVSVFPVRVVVAVVAVAMGAADRAEAAPPFPTLETVEDVLICMKEHGGQTLDNLYACSCSHDVVARSFGFDEFVEARTFETYRNMPGERGAVFRDSARGKALIARLQAAREDGARRCFQRLGGDKPEAVVPSESKVPQKAGDNKAGATAKKSAPASVL